MAPSRPDEREASPAFGWLEYMVMAGALAFVIGVVIPMLVDPRPQSGFPGLAELLLQAPAVDDTISRFGWGLAIIGLLMGAAGARLSDRY